MDEEALRILLSRSLAQRDIAEFLLFAYLDEKPLEAREGIMNFLVHAARQTVGEQPLPDHAAEMWADLCVRRVQEIEMSVQRVKALLVHAASGSAPMTPTGP